MNECIRVLLYFDNCEIDVTDPCQDNNGGCSQICTNADGEAECSCVDGYELSDNGVTCEGILQF